MKSIRQGAKQRNHQEDDDNTEVNVGVNTDDAPLPLERTCGVKEVFKKTSW